MLILESLENTEIKGRQKRNIHPYPRIVSFLIHDVYTVEILWCIHRHITNSQMDTCHCVDCFSSLNNLITQIIEYEFQRWTIPSTQILWGENWPSYCIMHLCIYRGGKDIFTNSPHIGFPL